MGDDDDVSGQKLGRYTLVRRLGKGGMGEVFLAKSSGARGFEKQVAIKRILPQYSENKHVVNMLVDEARICMLISHANVVQVLELDEDEGQESPLFIVMEYVDGHALSRLIRRVRKKGERLDALLACFVMIHVLEGLHAAHTQKDGDGNPAKIIHRDVSPQNVLLGMNGQVKVIDFGIARARDRLEATQGSQVKGKLRYMAPEQIKPSLAGTGGIDHRVDVFAAGVVLFEMLAMRQRFPQTGDLEIIDAILEEETPDLTGEGVDEELQKILEQALQKERRKRFKDASAFAAALRGYLYARDPAFTAEKLARVMRRIFAGEEDPNDAEEAAAPAPVVKKGKVTVKPLRAPEPEEPEHEETRTTMRPRVDDAPPPREKKKKSSGVPGIIIGATLGALLLVGGGVLVKNAMQPKQLPIDGPVTPPTPVTTLPTTPPTTPTSPPTPPSLQNTGVNSVAPPDRNGGGLVDLGGGVEMIVEAIPATARISLAYQPDPKYVSPARLKVQRGETVDLLFEAEGYEPLRKQFVAEGDLRFQVALVPIPLPLVLRPIPRDAEVLVNGEPARPGMKVNPGEIVTVTARHPFYVEKTVQVKVEPGQAVVVDITLEEKPPPPPGTEPGPDDFDRGLDKLAKQAKQPKQQKTGTLVVTSKPLYAQVFVDGKKLAATTPIRETLPAGSHKITVRGKSAEKTFTIEIAAGATVKKDVVLE